ncbi:MAG: ShlB/FhaC/HecB family hemolysin secretion/activation protein [Cyanobacteria bacterium P01_H01_bin.58]
MADITVNGSDRYQNYVSSRIEQASTDPLNQIEIEDQLQLLQLSGLFETLEATLRRGDRPGESLLDVTIEETNPVSGRAFIDNYSPTSVGEFRVGATVAYRSLMLPGDALSAGVSTTFSGGAQSYTVGYQIPLSPNDSTLRVGFTYEDFNVTDRDNPAFDLDLRGDTRIYEAEYRYPIMRTATEELGLSLGFRHRDGNSVILDIVTIPSRTSVFQISQDYLRRDRRGAWAALSQFSLGTGLLNATDNPDSQADGQFFSWLGQVQWVQVLSPDNLLIVRADLQLSGDSLLGSEQFLIGGAQSVRGYNQNVRAGDSGFRLAVENRIVVARRQDQEPFVQVVPFTDLGVVWFNDSSTQPTQENFLWGLGAGVIVNPIADLEMRLDVGTPLVTLDEVTDRNTGTQVYFSVGYRF